jgi:hypothetical protein
MRISAASFPHNSATVFPAVACSSVRKARLLLQAQLGLTVRDLRVQLDDACSERMRVSRSRQHALSKAAHAPCSATVCGHSSTSCGAFMSCRSCASSVSV